MSLDTAALAKIFPANSTYITNYGWVAIAGVAILGFGKEPMINALAEEILRRTAHSHNEDERVRAFRKLREGCLKASPLVGFPRVSSHMGLPLLPTRSDLYSVLPGKF